MADQIPNDSTPPVTETAPVVAPVEVPAAIDLATKLPNASAEKLGVIGEKAYGELKGFARAKANIVANFNVHKIAETGEVVKSGILGKGIKVGATGVGVALTTYGAKDIGQVLGVIGADVDEKGKEIPADGGKLVKGLAEVGAGLTAIYFTLLKGGKAAGLAK